MRVVRDFCRWFKAGLQDAEFRRAWETMAHVTSSARNCVMERADSAAGSPVALPVIRAEIQDAGSEGCRTQWLLSHITATALQLRR